jgi:hypothetical protein
MLATDFMRSACHLLGVLLALAGCSDDFAPYSDLDRLRILAVKADPATPLAGQTATLSALTFAPAGETISLHWTWCPVAAKASDAYACPLDQATASQVLGAFLDSSVGTDLPSLDLGYGTTASLTNPFSTAGLAALCGAGLQSPSVTRGFDCEGGYPVTVALDAATSSDTLRAGFVLRLPASDAAEINHNPAPTGLRLGGAPLLEAPTLVRLAPGATVDLALELPPTAPELRAIPSSEGPPGQRLERLTTSWFSSSGKIDKARTSFIDGVATLAEMSSNRFTAPAAEQWPAAGLVEFAAVVRDDRGGEDWLVRQAVLEMSP